MPLDSQGTIHLYGPKPNVAVTHTHARTAEAFVTLTVGTSHIVFEDQMITERAFEAIRRPANLGLIPNRAKFSFDAMPDASQLGLLARYRGTAPVFAVVRQGKHPHLRLGLGRLELRVYDQLALLPVLGLFRSAAELAPNVFLQPVRLPEPRTSRPEVFYADESPQVLDEPVIPVEAPRRPASIPSAFEFTRSHLLRDLG